MPLAMCPRMVYSPKIIFYLFAEINIVKICDVWFLKENLKINRKICKNLKNCTLAHKSIVPSKYKYYFCPQLFLFTSWIVKFGFIKRQLNFLYSFRKEKSNILIHKNLWPSE